MNVDLLSKMIKELILDKDKVALPGLGTFVAEMVPSTFSDKGYIINPPYRRLYFKQGGESDNLLSGLYASSNNVDAEVAGKVISDFISEMKQVLNKQKSVILPGLGRLRATKENNYFFVSDPDLDIYPDGFGLEPLSLKTNQWCRTAPIPVAEIHKPVAETSEQSVLETAGQIEETPASPAEIVPPEADSLAGEMEKQSESNGWKTFFVILAILTAIAVIALGVFVLLSDIAPDFIDSILYTEEELEILKY